MSRIIGLAIGMAVTLAAPAQAQTDGRAYYDFWPGSWYAKKDGARGARPSFVVKRGVQPLAFVEDWLLSVEGKDDRSQALRVWNPDTRRWSFVWTNQTGLYQIWDSVRVGNDWYITRPFERDGKRWLSRQAWIPDGRDAVNWVMERSDDAGKSWTVRARTRFVRGS